LELITDRDELTIGMQRCSRSQLVTAYLGLLYLRSQICDLILILPSGKKAKIPDKKAATYRSGEVAANIMILKKP